LNAAASGAEGDARSGGSEPLSRVLFALLVVACFVAFFLTQRLKHTPTVVQRFELTSNFSPTPAGRHKQEQISFKLSHAERATVAVIDSDGNVVATLLGDYAVPRYKQLSLRWNGRRGRAHGYRVSQTASGRSYIEPDNTGAPAPNGEYRVRLTLSRQHEPVLSPRSFALVGR
jgi:hypothetical protein